MAANDNRPLEALESELQSVMEQERSIRQRKRELSAAIDGKVRALMEERNIPAGLQHEAEEA